MPSAIRQARFVRQVCTTCKLLHTVNSHRFSYNKKRILKAGGAAVLSVVLIGGAAIVKVINSVRDNLSHTLPSLSPDSAQNEFSRPANTSLLAYLLWFSSRQGETGSWVSWWLSHSDDPWTLLQLARSSRRSVRLLGVQALARSHDWSDAEYHAVANACDSRTLIGLARSPGVDKRFFLPTSKTGDSQESVEASFARLLSQLPVDETDECTRYFTVTALQDPTSPVTDETSKGFPYMQTFTSKPEEKRKLYYLHAVVKQSQGRVWSPDGIGVSLAEERDVVPALRRLFVRLQALYNVSIFQSHVPLIVQNGGLQLLRRICDEHEDNLKVQRAVARIMGNLALCDTVHDRIVQAGWVKVLFDWSGSEDLALSLHAARALANLDHDYSGDRLDDGMYIYHPTHRYSKPVYADVIFVHGLLGGPFRTWRQRDFTPDKQTAASSKPTSQNTATTTQDKVPETQGTVPGNKTANHNDRTNTANQSERIDLANHETGRARVKATNQNQEGTANKGDTEYTYCWPKDWLAADCPHIRVLTVEYETHLSEWAPRCPYESEKRSLQRRSNILMDKLQKAGVGTRPIIWVGHSMGGLLIKQMLVNANQSSDPALQSIVEQSLGAVLYSVPHRGSALANYSSQAQYILYPSVEVKELKQNSPLLMDLHSKFEELVFREGIPLLSFGETQKVSLPLNVKVVIVPLHSSDPGFGEFHAVEENHLNICKPDSAASSLYLLTRDFIEHCILAHMEDSEPKEGIADDVLIHETTSSARTLFQ